jgi:CspA family cold shock protein
MMRQKGTVKWFNNAKGFGFITADEGADRDIFVHYSALNQDGYRTLREGDSVEFELVDGPKGPSASDVKCLEVREDSDSESGSESETESETETETESESESESESKMEFQGQGA